MEVIAMFFDVKVMDPQGHIKKIVSSQELSKLHWRAFQLKEDNKTMIPVRNSKFPRWAKKKLDLEFR